MNDPEKKKPTVTEQADNDKKWKKASPDVCEICGHRMERDPESGEYYCPFCDDSDF